MSCTRGTIFRRILPERLQPSILPENKAARLAAAMCRPVATSIEMHRLAYPPPSNWKNRVARLVCALVHLKPLVAERKHLRHEGHAIQLPVAVKRPQNLF